MAKVSVIVPIYNTKKFLRKCLNSVVAQTLEDIEIICVDDGSTDGCSEILDQFAIFDNRIKVIHKPNGGYGQTMNVGLETASGEYIGIVESDDIILPMMYETLYNRAVLFDLDMVKSDCYLYWETFDKWIYCNVDDTRANYNKVFTASDRQQMFLFWMFTWTGIYRRDFLLNNGIRWNESPGASYQDNGFWVQTMAMSKRAMWINEAFYLYRQDNPMSSMKNKEKMMAMTYEYDHTERELRGRGLEEERGIANYFRLQELTVTYRRISDQLKPEFKKVIREQFEKYRYDCTLLRGDYDSDWVISGIKEIIEHKDSTNDTYLVGLKRKLDNMVKEAKHIIFYGTGTRADQVWKRLYNNGYTEYIDVVTETEPTEGAVFWGKPIVKFGNVNMEKNETLVIIAVGERLFPELKSVVIKAGYTKYISAKAICDSLWSM